ncbi:MAG: GNAT family N-acetyltransferase [Actinomycetota bacterium]
MSTTGDRPGEATRVGLDYLEAITALLQRIRSDHPTVGLYEAADLQWWWRTERSTDELPQLFWFDADGRPEAAVIATDWGDGIALDPHVLPGAPAERVAEVVERGLAHAAELGFDSVELEADRGDEALLALLADHGFTTKEAGLGEAWLDADRLPAISELADGYRLLTRADTADRPHHMISEQRGHRDPEPRFRQSSLYRSDLDLVVLADDGVGETAAYGLFWHDPVSGTGLVEPMRTEEAHQRRGLARHVLTAGVNRLARAGAERIKICYELGAPAADLYLGVGFETDRETDILVGPTRPAAVVGASGS